MAGDGDQRTEQPTAARRREARRAGRVPFSRDLVGIVGVAAGFGWVAHSGLSALGELGGGVRRGLEEAVHGAALPVDRVVEACRAGLASGLRIWLPLGLLVLAATLLAGLIQTGFLVRPAALAPGLSRVSPRAGLARVFSGRAAGRGLFAVLKLAWLGAVAFHYGRGALGDGGTLAPDRILGGSPVDLASRTLGVVVDVAFVAVAGLVVLAIADLFFQRWQQERELRMTRRELLQELKEQEPDPRIRQRQRHVARGRMRRAARSRRAGEGGDR